MKRALLSIAIVAACQKTPPPDIHAGHTQAVHHQAMNDAPAGYAPVMVDDHQAAAMGLATAKVERADFTKTLRTVGVIALDETRSAHVHTKIRGWIDKLYVDFVGKRVEAGTPLCSIYSQDVYAAEMELLSILDRPPVVAGEFANEEKKAQGQLIAAAERRLALWDVPKTEIDRLRTAREPRRTFPLLAPRAGSVVAKQAIDGTYVDPSLELYTLSDLSRVWALVDIYEADVPDVHVGAHSQLSIEGVPEPVHAMLTFLPPTIDEPTRTLKARYELDNSKGLFRPGAFVTAQIHLEMGSGLAVPESSVIRTGTRSIVFVVHGEHLEPHEVVLGPSVGARYRVDSGLNEGDVVATGAQFLLDSESRLRATSARGGGHAGHVH